ncbi:hypothetical protein HPG69_000213, partial [Diceros bicornis minor]
PQCTVFFSQMLTYILSFLPLSDQKEASIVSHAWYCAAQNALQEVRACTSVGAAPQGLLCGPDLGLPGPAYPCGCNSLFTSSMLLVQLEMAQRVQQTWSCLRELNRTGLRDQANPCFSWLSGCAPSLERLSLAYCHVTFKLGPAWGSIRPQDSSPSQLSFHNLLGHGSPLLPATRPYFPGPQRLLRTG